MELCVHAQSLSHVWLFATLGIVARQAPLSMGFSRQEYWSGVPFPTPEDLPSPGIEPPTLVSPALAGRFFTRRHGFNPWVGKIPQRRKCQPTPVFFPGESRGQRSLVGYCPWGCKESDMTYQINSSDTRLIHIVLFFIYLINFLTALWSILVPWSGIKPVSPEWNCGVLNPGPPRKPLISFLLKKNI